MNKERQSIQSSIIEISSIDSVSKEITMVVHKIDSVNGNGLDFKEEYVGKFKETIVNKPVVAKYFPLKDDLGDHEAIYDSSGKIIGLETIAIGTIKEVWIDDLVVDSETTVKALYTKADLWNYKYPEIVSCVEKIFSDGYADTSVEVEIYSYGDNPTQQYRYATDYCYIGNCILGSDVTPADSDAGVISVAQKEIAMAAHKDLQSIEKEMKGDDTVTEVFNKGIEIKFHGIEVSSLKLKDVSSQIYNLLNPLNPTNNKRQYNYYIRDVFVDFVICESEHDYSELWKIPYTITDNQVVISAQEQWVKGQLGFIPDGVNLDQLQTQVTELNTKIEELKKEAELHMDKTIEELQAELATKNTEIADFKTKLEELESKITELNSTVVTQEEAKAGLEGQITELNSKVEALVPFKEQVEKAEKDAKVAELSAKYSKLLSEETFKSEDVQTAITELNSQQLNEIVVAEIAKEKIVETASTKTDDTVTIVASKQEDLLPRDKHEYWTASSK